MASSSSAPEAEVATAAAEAAAEQEEDRNGRPDAIVEVPVGENDGDDDDDGDDDVLDVILHPNFRPHFLDDDDFFLDLVEGDGDEDDGSSYDELDGSGGSGEDDEPGVDSDPAGESSPPNCPICFRGLASCGPHRVCCLPCGHVYGRSCLEKWLRRCGETAGKCPQCNRNFRLMDIINIYAPVNVVPNDSPKDLCSLNENNDSLKTLSAQQDLKPRILEEKPLLRFTMGSDRLDASSSTDVTITAEATMSRIAQLEERVAAIEAQMPRIANLEAQVSQLVDLQSEMAELRNEIVELRNKMTVMQTEMIELRNSVAEVRRMCDNIHGIEAPVQVAKRRRL